VSREKGCNLADRREVLSRKLAHPKLHPEMGFDQNQQLHDRHGIQTGFKEIAFFAKFRPDLQDLSGDQFKKLRFFLHQRCRFMFHFSSHDGISEITSPSTESLEHIHSEKHRRPVGQADHEEVLFDMNSAVPASTHPSLALSLAASHLGFHVHAGFMEVLASQGIRPGHIGAASSGAFVGGLYAAGISTVQIREMLASLWMANAFWEWRGPLRGLGMLANLAGHTGLLSGRKVLRLLKEHLGDFQIEDCPAAELSLAVTNLTKGRSQIVRRGPLAEYIVASCAVPGIFRHIEIAGEAFWDGAVSDSSPFQHFFADSRVDAVLVHVVTHVDIDDRRTRPTVAWAFGQAHQIVSDRLLALGVECGQILGRRVLVLRSEVPRFPFWQKSSHQQLFDAGRHTATENLAAIQGLCEN